MKDFAKLDLSLNGTYFMSYFLNFSTYHSLMMDKQSFKLHILAFNPGKPQDSNPEKAYFIIE